LEECLQVTQAVVFRGGSNYDWTAIWLQYNRATTILRYGLPVLDCWSAV